MAKKMKTDSVIIATEKIETKVLSGMVTVVGTGKVSLMPAGRVYVVSGPLANTLISKGFATLKD